MTKPTVVSPQVLILPDVPPDKINGIHIPQKARKETNSGIVIAVPEGSFLNEGDHVCFNHRQGYQVEHLLSINENYIVGLKTDNLMQPLFDKVLVQPIKKGITESKGGILIGEDANISEGLVLKTGKGKKDEPMVLTEGDKIIYPKHAGTPIGDNIVLEQTEAIAITNEDEEA